MENYTSFDRVLLKVLKIPGALMIVPLFLGVIFNTFAPEVLNIGSFTTALFKNGLAVLIGLFFLSVGSQISFRSALPSVEKGIVLLVAKFGIAVIFGLSVAFFAPDGVLFGLLPLAIIAGMSNSNGSLYVELPPKNWTPIQLLKVSSEHGNEFQIGNGYTTLFQTSR